MQFAPLAHMARHAGDTIFEGLRSSAAQGRQDLDETPKRSSEAGDAKCCVSRGGSRDPAAQRRPSRPSRFARESRPHKIYMHRAHFPVRRSNVSDWDRWANIDISVT